MTVKWSFALILCLILFVIARPVSATDCAPATAEQSMAWASTIVIGRVTARDDSVLIQVGKTIRIPETGIPHTIEVERIYKGAPGAVFRVHQQMIVGAPGLQVGERWLLFLHSDPSGNLSAGPCMPSSKLAPGASPHPAVAAVIGPGWEPGSMSPLGSPLGSRTMLIAGALGALLVAAGLGYLWFRRRNMNPH